MALSLDKNTFYRSLVSIHHSLFTQASNNCWLIAVPLNKKLGKTVIDRFFVEAHFLKASPFLKSHYVPVRNADVEDVELSSNELIVKRAKTGLKARVRILGAEDAYNAKNQLYRILIVDRPLTKDHLSASIDDEDSDMKEVVSSADCRQYLLSLCASAVSDIDDKIRNLNESEEVFHDDLQSVVRLFTTITDAAISTFSKSCQGTDEAGLLEYATESLVLEPFHDRLMQLIVKEFGEQGDEISLNCALMQNLKLDMSSLGTEADLDPFQPREQILSLLSDLDSRKTPIEKMVTFREVSNLIREDLMKCIETAHSPFDPSPLKTLVPDDLVAATIYTLSQNHGQQVFYHLNFVQTFGSHLPAMNELAYSMVTFEVALAYIRNYKPEEKGRESVSSSDAGFAETESPVEKVFPWQKTPNKQQEPSSSPSARKERSNSFMSFRTRDPRFDQHLKELSRLVDDISFNDSLASGSGTDAGMSSSPTTAAGDMDEELGSFLNSLHQQKFTVNYGKLTD